uniref:Uncharacterized protein n=1 Tax=Cyprinus carpio TaxID=7962 RepID=A0A8C2KLM3_CYPCA
ILLTVNVTITGIFKWCFPNKGKKQEQIPIRVTVTNKFVNTKVSYPTAVTVGMPMFGVLNKLKDTNNSFNFTYSINESFCIYPESVNGLAGSTENHTYWELLSKKGNRITRLNVGRCRSLIL